MARFLVFAALFLSLALVTGCDSGNKATAPKETLQGGDGPDKRTDIKMPSPPPPDPAGPALPK